MNYSFLVVTKAFWARRATASHRKTVPIVERVRDLQRCIYQKICAQRAASASAASQTCLFMAGVMLLILASGSDAEAARNIEYDPTRVTAATNGLLLYLEGSFGALVMVASGIGAILSSAFGQYRAALGLMVVAIGSFILRSLLGTFFNDAGIAE